MSEISILTIEGVSFNLSDDALRSNISGIENNIQASKDYNIGDYLIYDSGFYKVIEAITSGDLLEIDVNITSVKVGDELKAKASIESPTFFGSPKVPTADVGTRTTQIANTAYVQSELDSVRERIQSVQNGLDGIDSNIGDRVTAVAASTTTAWMNAHITNTDTTILDTSLTIEGAEADAKAVGDAINELDSSIDNRITSLNGDIMNLQTGKQDRLQFDDVPIQNSENMVNSGTVYTAINTVQSSVLDNMYNLDKLTYYNTFTGYTLRGNGLALEKEGYTLDRYYPLEPGTKLYVKALKDDEYVYQFQTGLVFGSLVLIGQASSEAVNGILEVPEGAKCLCIARRIENVSNEVYAVSLKYGDQMNDITSRMDDIEPAVYNEVSNLFEGTIVPDGYYNASGEWIDSTTYKMAVLPVGAIISGDTLFYSKEFSYYQTSYWFDVLQADGTWIKRYNVSDYVPVQIVVDSEYGDFYVAMRIRSTHDQTKLIISKTPNLVKEPSVTVLKRLVSPLSYKTINCLGDSFTSPYASWCNKLALRVGCVCNNYGVGGSRISIDSTTEASFVNRVQSMSTDADITIIFGGINDCIELDSGNLTIGDIDSALDTTTFFGALKLLITNIKSYLPGKKIIGVIPPDFLPSERYTTWLPLVQQACRDVYEYFGIPYCDLKKNCQEFFEDTYNNNTYRKVAENNWHPSALGQEVISEAIQGTLCRYITM